MTLAIAALTCENETSPRGATNTPRALTHLSDYTGRQAAVTLSSSEQWRPIPGFEGLYEVSDQGRVKTLPRWRITHERIHKGAVRPSDGHIQVNLRKDGHAYPTYAHTLVMLAFVGPRPEGADIRHLNGDPTDNRLDNLTYGSRSENLHDAVRHGAHHQTRKTRCRWGHRLIEPNLRACKSALGHRGCLACHRAQAALSKARRQGQPFDFRVAADEQYARILAAAR